MGRLESEPPFCRRCGELPNLGGICGTDVALPFLSPRRTPEHMLLRETTLDIVTQMLSHPQHIKMQ